MDDYIKFSELTEVSVLPSDGDHLVLLISSPTLRTVKIPWSVVRGAFSRYVQTPPAEPATAGEIGDYSVDTNYYYTHDGIAWGRTKRDTGDWTTPEQLFPRYDDDALLSPTQADQLMQNMGIVVSVDESEVTLTTRSGAEKRFVLVD